MRTQPERKHANKKTEALSKLSKMAGGVLRPKEIENYKRAKEELDGGQKRPGTNKMKTRTTHTGIGQRPK